MASDMNLPLSSMTLYELFPLYTKLQKRYEYAQERVAGCERRLIQADERRDKESLQAEKVIAYWEKRERTLMEKYRPVNGDVNSLLPQIQMKINYARGRVAYYAHSVIPYLEARVRDSGEWLQQELTRMNRTKADMEEVDALIQRLKATDCVEAEPLTLSIRLLSGDVLTMCVDRSQRIASFPDIFCQRFGFQPCATKRMTFLQVMEEAKHSEEQEEEIFWSVDVRREEEVIGDRLTEGAILHLLIQPLEDPEWSERFALLCKILDSANRYATVSDEEIFGIYSNWILTWISPPRSNRYIRMKAFMEEHEDIFPMKE